MKKKKRTGFAEAVFLLTSFKKNIVANDLRDVFVDKIVLKMSDEKLEAATRMSVQESNLPLGYLMDLADQRFDDVAWFKITDQQEMDLPRGNVFAYFATVDEIVTKNLQDELDLLWNTAQQSVDDPDLDPDQNEKIINLLGDFGKDIDGVCVSEPSMAKSMWRWTFGDFNLYLGAQAYFHSAVHNNESTARARMNMLCGIPD